jgi:hypothetical protein
VPGIALATVTVSLRRSAPRTHCSACLGPAAIHGSGVKAGVFSDIATRFGSWSANRPLHRGLYAGAAIVIAGATLVMYSSMGTLVGTSRWVKHTPEMTHALEEIMLNLASAEASHCGCLVTANGNFIPRLERAHKHLLKPLSFEGLLFTVKALDSYWLETNRALRAAAG